MFLPARVPSAAPPAQHATEKLPDGAVHAQLEFLEDEGVQESAASRTSFESAVVGLPGDTFMTAFRGCTPNCPGLERLYDSALLAVGGLRTERKLPLCVAEDEIDTPSYIVLRRAASNWSAFGPKTACAVMELQDFLVTSGNLTTSNAGKRVRRIVVDGVYGEGLLARAFGWSLDCERAINRPFATACFRANMRKTYAIRNDEGRGYSFLWSLEPVPSAEFAADLVGSSAYVVLVNVTERRLEVVFRESRVSLGPAQLIMFPGHLAYGVEGGGVGTACVLRALLVPVHYELFEHGAVTDAGRTRSDENNVRLSDFPDDRRAVPATQEDRAAKC